MEIRIEDFAAREVIFTRRVGAYAQSAPQAWQALWAWVASQGHGEKIKRVIGIGWDSPAHTPAAECRYDACMELHEPVAGDPDLDIALQTLPGGMHAVHRMVGPYHQMPDTIMELLDSTLPERGLIVDPVRPVLEIYVNDPTQVPETDLLTDLCIPIET